MSDLPYWLALVRAPHFTSRQFLQIWQVIPDISKWFVDVQDLRQFNLRPETIDYLRHPNWHEIEKDLAWEKAATENYIVPINSPYYPKRLLEISSSPWILFVKGHVDILTSNQIAIVGSRRPTPNGKENAFHFSQRLSQAGLVITSGLAVGIDMAAHHGALEQGKTLAVMGTGVDRIYPASNRSLADKIIEKGGAIISEFLLGVPPLPTHFPRRNRLISGLSLGTLVVEADIKSGSLITACFATEQGREVFAIPGSIHNPRVRGCHWLIKQGAKLVESVEDVLEELPAYERTVPPSPPPQVRSKNTLAADHMKLLECIDYEPTKIDMLVSRTQFAIQLIASLLVDLELEGYITSTSGGYMRVT